jgi:CBS domain-containing protein
MLRVRDIMTRDVTTVTPELPLREAIDVLVTHHVSGAPVVQNERVVGIVTASDLLDFVSSLPGGGQARTTRGAWEDLPPNVDGEEERNTSALTEPWRDLSAAALASLGASNLPEGDRLEQHTVADVMTAGSPHGIEPGASIIDVAKRMREADIHRLLVMEGDRLVGIVTSTDVTQAVADGKVDAGDPPD